MAWPFARRRRAHPIVLPRGFFPPAPQAPPPMAEVAVNLARLAPSEQRRGVVAYARIQAGTRAAELALLLRQLRDLHDATPEDRRLLAALENWACPEMAPTYEGPVRA